MSERARIEITEELAGQRLDRCLANHFSDYSRSHLQRLIAEGRVTVNGAEVTQRSSSVQSGDSVCIRLPDPPRDQLLPASFDLPLLHEDDDLLVINKPADLVIHPGAGTGDTPTLVHALLGYDYQRFSDMLDDEQRPGIVHRLDKDTSGVLVVARHAQATSKLARQFADRSVRKLYLAVVAGAPFPTAGTIDARIGRHPVKRHKMTVLAEGGRRAVSHYQTLAASAEAALLLVRIETGRTHQIRVHLSDRGHAVLGDTVYGSHGGAAPRQLLHAWHLCIRHPRSGELLAFTAPPPDDFADACAALGLSFPDAPAPEALP